MNSDMLAYICGVYLCIKKLSMYLSEFRYCLNSDISSYMCGATHPRNLHGVGKAGSILQDYQIHFILDITWAHSSMILGQMMLGGVVSVIIDTLVPEETQL